MYYTTQNKHKKLKRGLLAFYDIRLGNGAGFQFSLPSVILIDSSTGSPVHVLKLSIQAVRSLPTGPYV